MIDYRDKIIIQQLRKNAKLSSRALSKITGLPISTVHRRIKSLEKKGIIKGYRAVIDYEKIGIPIKILVFINVCEYADSYQKTEISTKKIFEKLKEIGEVVEIVMVEGKDDIILKAVLRSLRDIPKFLDRIRNTPGIEEIDSCIVIEEVLK